MHASGEYPRVCQWVGHFHTEKHVEPTVTYESKLKSGAVLACKEIRAKWYSLGGLGVHFSGSVVLTTTRMLLSAIYPPQLRDYKALAEMLYTQVVIVIEQYLVDVARQRVIVERRCGKRTDVAGGAAGSGSG